ncbi:MAG: hypothetical protein JWN04_5616 [Myxococcaceae bacterium]|nr:hypothetical protein [Myxococcaceae bacterium]
MATHSTLVGYVLWLFGGYLGLHRLYFGKRATGALYFLTLGLGGVGWLVDLFLIPRIRVQMSRRYQAGRYNYSVAWLLLAAWPLGFHRFYVGRWATGLLYLGATLLACVSVLYGQLPAAAALAGLVAVAFAYDLLTFNELLSEANERWISGDAALGVT